MKSGIKDLVREVAAKAADTDAAAKHLQRKLEATKKEISGVECRFESAEIGLVLVIGGKCFDPDTFANICNWFGKHWGQGDDGYETEPAADPE